MKNDRIYTLLNVEAGVSKTGRPWAKALLKGYTDDGKSKYGEIYIPYNVAQRLITNGTIEDINVTITGGLDEYMRPCVTDLEPVIDLFGKEKK